MRVLLAQKLKNCIELHVKKVQKATLIQLLVTQCLLQFFIKREGSVVEISVDIVHLIMSTFRRIEDDLHGINEYRGKRELDSLNASSYCPLSRSPLNSQTRRGKNCQRIEVEK